MFVQQEVAAHGRGAIGLCHPWLPRWGLSQKGRWMWHHEPKALAHAPTNECTFCWGPFFGVPLPASLVGTGQQAFKQGRNGGKFSQTVHAACKGIHYFLCAFLLQSRCSTLERTCNVTIYMQHTNNRAHKSE